MFICRRRVGRQVRRERLSPDLFIAQKEGGGSKEEVMCMRDQEQTNKQICRGVDCYDDDDDVVGGQVGEGRGHPSSSSSCSVHYLQYIHKNIHTYIPTHAQSIIYIYIIEKKEDKNSWRQTHKTYLPTYLTIISFASSLLSLHQRMYGMQMTRRQVHNNK